jgi:hypothetical protein
MVPGALRVEDLRAFAPVSYRSIAEARELGVIDDQEIGRAMREGLFSAVPDDLRIFYATAHYIDRKRDIAEALERLAHNEGDGATPLWMLLARLILQQYGQDPNSAVNMLEDLYQWCHQPQALRPFTLYAGAYRSTAETVGELDTFLRSRGL